MGKPSVLERHEVDSPEYLVLAAAAEHRPLEKPGPKLAAQPQFKGASEFSKAILLEQNHIKTGSRILSGTIAVVLHVVVIAGPILAGLYYTDSINVQPLAAIELVAPPPPPPPPAANAMVKMKVMRHSLIHAGQLMAPTVIPRHIAEIKEPPPEPSGLDGVAGGVPGGVPGGQLGGVLGGIVGGVLNTAARPAPPPPATKPSGPIRVGGHVRPPQIIVKVPPEYPVLAREAHVQGQVQIDAILDEQGNVVEMKVVSGPPLLYQAALNALKKWKYEPTYLNDKPIAVQMIVTVNFQLGQYQ